MWTGVSGVFRYLYIVFLSSFSLSLSPPRLRLLEDGLSSGTPLSASSMPNLIVNLMCGVLESQRGRLFHMDPDLIRSVSAIQSLSNLLQLPATDDMQHLLVGDMQYLLHEMLSHN